MSDKTSVTKKVIKAGFYLALVALPIAFWLNRFAIYDWWRLRDYSPPARIQELANETTMNNQTKRVFYAQHPQIDNKQELHANCQTEYTIVLGCYVSTKGIYLYDVTDPRLNGVEEVTAAHELLHAEYDRLSSSDKKKVNELTAKAYEQLKDERIRATVEQYRKHDPSVVPNELHSILGTEVRNLSPELEAHYKKFFTDRLAIAKFSEQYENEFTSRQKQVDDYDQQLKELKNQIAVNEEQLDSQSANLSEQRRQLESLRGNPAAFNAEVGNFNAQVAAYNKLAAQTKVLIDKYNDIVIKRNALAVEVNDLAKAIDTRPQGLSTE